MSNKIMAKVYEAKVKIGWCEKHGTMTVTARREGKTVWLEIIGGSINSKSATLAWWREINEAVIVAAATTRLMQEEAERERT